MKSARYIVPAALAVITFAACGDPTSSDSLFDDSAVTADVAASAGDAVAIMLGTMVDNETFASTDAPPAFAAPHPASNINVVRSRTCYDASNVAVANCLPFSSVRMMVIAATIS